MGYISIKNSIGKLTTEETIKSRIRIDWKKGIRPEECGEYKPIWLKGGEEHTIA